MGVGWRLFVVYVYYVLSSILNFGGCLTVLEFERFPSEVISVQSCLSKTILKHHRFTTTDPVISKM